MQPQYKLFSLISLIKPQITVISVLPALQKLLIKSCKAHPTLCLSATPKMLKLTPSSQSEFLKLTLQPYLPNQLQPEYLKCIKNLKLMPLLVPLLLPQSNLPQYNSRKFLSRFTTSKPENLLSTPRPTSTSKPVLPPLPPLWDSPTTVKETQSKDKSLSKELLEKTDLSASTPTSEMQLSPTGISTSTPLTQVQDTHKIAEGTQFPAPRH